MAEIRPLPALELWPPEIVDKILKSLPAPGVSPWIPNRDLVNFGAASRYARSLALPDIFANLNVTFQRKKKTFWGFHQFLCQNQDIATVVRGLNLTYDPLVRPGYFPILETQLLTRIVSFLPRLETLYISNVRVFSPDMPTLHTHPSPLTRLLLAGVASIGHQPFDDVIDILRIFPVIKEVILLDVASKAGATYLLEHNFQAAQERAFPKVQQLDIFGITHGSVLLPVIGRTSGSALTTLNIGCDQPVDVTGLGGFLVAYGYRLKSLVVSLQNMNLDPQAGVLHPQDVINTLAGGIKSCNSLHNFQICCTIPNLANPQIWRMILSLVVDLPCYNLRHLSIVVDGLPNGPNPWTPPQAPWHSIRHACSRFRGIRTIQLCSRLGINAEVQTVITEEMAHWHKRRVLFTGEFHCMCLTDGCPFYRVRT